jgi:hypothetical protein
MRTLRFILATCALVLSAAAAEAITVTTIVDESTRMVRLDFTDLPPYEQIRLEAVTALYWCNCIDPNNPSSLRSSSFTVNGGNLEMKYEGVPPPSTNFIEYHYLEGYVFTGYETVDWIVVTESGGDEQTLTANRPVLAPIPEPSTGLLCLIGLAATSVTRRSRRAARHSPRPTDR